MITVHISISDLECFLSKKIALPILRLIGGSSDNERRFMAVRGFDSSFFSPANAGCCPERCSTPDIHYYSHSINDDIDFSYYSD